MAAKKPATPRAPRAKKATAAPEPEINRKLQGQVLLSNQHRKINHTHFDAVLVRLFGRAEADKIHKAVFSLTRPAFNHSEDERDYSQAVFSINGGLGASATITVVVQAATHPERFNVAKVRLPVRPGRPDKIEWNVGEAVLSGAIKFHTRRSNIVIESAALVEPIHKAANTGPIKVRIQTREGTRTAMLMSAGRAVEDIKTTVREVLGGFDVAGPIWMSESDKMVDQIMARVAEVGDNNYFMITQPSGSGNVKKHILLSIRSDVGQNMVGGVLEARNSIVFGQRKLFDVTEIIDRPMTGLAAFHAVAVQVDFGGTDPDSLDPVEQFVKNYFEVLNLGSATNVRWQRIDDKLILTAIRHKDGPTGVPLLKFTISGKTLLNPEFPDVSLPVVGGSTGDAIVTGTYSSPAGVVLELSLERGSICRRDRIAIYRDKQIAATGIVDNLRHYAKEVEEMKFDSDAKERSLLCGATVRLDREFVVQKGDKVRAVGKYVNIGKPKQDVHWDFKNSIAIRNRTDHIAVIQEVVQKGELAGWAEGILHATTNLLASSTGDVAEVNIHLNEASDPVPEHLTMSMRTTEMAVSVQISKVNDCFVHSSVRRNATDDDSIAHPNYEGLYNPVEVLHVLRNCCAAVRSDGELLKTERLEMEYIHSSPAFSHELVELRAIAPQEVAVFGITGHSCIHIGVLYVNSDNRINAWHFWEKENPVHAEFKNYLHSVDFDPLSPGYQLQADEGLNRIIDLLDVTLLDPDKVRHDASTISGIQPSDVLIFNRQGRQVVLQVVKTDGLLDTPRHAGTFMTGISGRITSINFFKALPVPKSAHGDSRRTPVRPGADSMSQGNVAPHAIDEAASKPTKWDREITGLVRGEDFCFTGPFSHPFNITAWINALAEVPARWKSPTLDALTEVLRVGEEAALQSKLPWADVNPELWQFEITSYVRKGRRAVTVGLMFNATGKAEQVAGGYCRDLFDYGVSGVHPSLVYGVGAFGSMKMLVGVPSGLNELVDALVGALAVTAPSSSKPELEKELFQLYPDDQKLILVPEQFGGNYRLVGQYASPNQVLVFKLDNDRIVGWQRQDRAPEVAQGKPKAEVVRPAPQGRFENLLGYQAQSLAGLWFGASNDPSHPRNVLSDFVERIHERCKDGGTENALVFDVDVTCAVEGCAGTFTISAHVFGTDEKFSSIASITEAVTEA